MCCFYVVFVSLLDVTLCLSCLCYGLLVQWISTAIAEWIFSGIFPRDLHSCDVWCTTTVTVTVTVTITITFIITITITITTISCPDPYRTARAQRWPGRWRPGRRGSP